MNNLIFAPDENISLITHNENCNDNYNDDYSTPNTRRVEDTPFTKSSSPNKQAPSTSVREK